MSGIALVLGSEDPGSAVRAVVSAMVDRGDENASAHDFDGGAMAVATFGWQEQLCGGSVGQYGDVLVVADASIYYRDDLIRQLAGHGVRARSRGSADLIAAAVATWDTDAPHRLEGDFAYVAYRVSTRSGHGARDPIGNRPLFFAAKGGRLTIASSPSALVRAKVCPGDLNTEWLGELAGGLINVGSECAFRHVTALRQGERIRFDAAGQIRVDAWFVPPPFTESGSSSRGFEDAAQELRSLIAEAVRQRLDPDCPTFVSLSGGRDSTAVYAAGRHVAGDRIRSVSLSYPSGNMGREDETILEVTAQWGGDPKWVETMRVPLLAHVAGDVMAHDAFRHPYEATTRAMADFASSANGRVILNGLGGDTLFHAEPSYLADLLRGGRWPTFRQELRALRINPNVRNVFRWGILPVLGPRSRNLISTIRGGKPVRDVWDPPLAPWLTVSENRVLERAWAEPYRRLRKGGAGDRERRFMIEGPFAGRVVPEYARISALRGIEQRAPLYDLRVLAFAATRPREERRKGNDHKRLLRAAMVGWLPTSVTSPRNNPTGFTGDYLREKVVSELPQLVALYGDRMLLDELGLLFASHYRAEVDRLAKTGDHPSTAALVFTALTESWLRKQQSGLMSN